MLPLVEGGEFAKSLERGRAAALRFYEMLRTSADFLTAFPPELDILIFAPRASTASEASRLSRRVFEEAAKLDLHLAVAELPSRFWAEQNAELCLDRPALTCLRSVLMKPEHWEWVDEIWKRLQEATVRARAAS